MRKTTFAGLLPFQPFALVLILVGVAPVAFAQSTAPSTDREDAFLLNAAKTYDLLTPGVPPWRLRVHFQLFDGHGNPADQGTFEEIRTRPSTYKLSYTSEGFTQTQYGTDQDSFATGSTQPVPLPLTLLSIALVSPMPRSDWMERFLKDSANMGVVTEDRAIDGLSLKCFDLIKKFPVVPVEPLATYCFDGQGTLARYSVGIPSFGDTIVRNSVEFRGLMIPGDVTINLDGVPVVSAHVESVEPFSASDESELKPPSDAVPFFPIMPVPRTLSATDDDAGSRPAIPTSCQPPGAVSLPKKINISAGVAQQLLIEKTEPIYTPEAAAARVSGTVVVQVTITTEGVIESLHVISGPAMLRQPALEAVKNWRYRPYLLNGAPIEVETTVNVIFRPQSPPNE